MRLLASGIILKKILLNSAKIALSLKNMTITPIPKGKNKKNEILLSLFCEIVDLAKTNNKMIIFAGGLTVDIEAAVGRGDELLTREHADVDMGFSKKDLSFWRNWFETNDFLIKSWSETPHPEYNFYADRSYFFGNEEIVARADLGAFIINPDSTLYDLGYNIQGTIPFSDLVVQRYWMGRNILMECYEKTLADKRKENAEKGEPPRKKDIHDHALFDIAWNNLT
jgi:hypothetical protein